MQAWSLLRRRIRSATLSLDVALATSTTVGQGTMAASGGLPLINKLLVAFSVSVFLFEWVVYNVVFLGRILPTVDKEEWIPLFAVLFNGIWLLAFLTFCRVHTSNPGVITEQWRAFVQNTTGLDVIVSRQEWQPGKCTTNNKSKEIRPERAHFCSMMGMDVLRMDHYCPWTGNVIGFKNHKFFILLGWYGALSALVAFATSLPWLIQCAIGRDDAVQDVILVDRIFFFAFGVFAFMVMMLLTGLTVSHFPLACRNMTTIEETYQNMPNPYDQQSWFANLCEIFGDFGLDWFLPVDPMHPRSDGFSYKRQGEVLPEGLIEVYQSDSWAQEAFKREGSDPFMHADNGDEPVLARLPEDIWHFRYAGRPRSQAQPEVDNSWFAWLTFTNSTAGR